MNYKEFANTKEFKEKCNTNLYGRTAFKHDWLYLFGDNAEVSIYLTTRGTVLIFDHYYNQTYEDTPCSLMRDITKLKDGKFGVEDSVLFPIGFGGDIAYNFCWNDMVKLRMADGFINSMWNDSKLDDERAEDLWCVVHDMFYEFDAEPTEERIANVIGLIPEDIMDEVLHWGAGDTCVRDRICSFMDEETIEKIMEK